MLQLIREGTVPFPPLFFMPAKVVNLDSERRGCRNFLAWGEDLFCLCLRHSLNRITSRTNGRCLTLRLLDLIQLSAAERDKNEAVQACCRSAAGGRRREREGGRREGGGVEWPLHW